MDRHHPVVVVLLVLTLAAWSLLSGCQGLASGTTATPQDAKSRINHIVWMLQENRSFDTYFGKLNEYRASQGLGQDVDGLTSNASNPTFDCASQVAAFKLQTQCTENMSPSWNESHRARNRQDPTSATATMDGFVWTAAHFAQDSGFRDVQGLRAMGYYDASALPYYYFMASQFATSDRWFSPVMARTQPNRIFDFAATTAGHVYEPTTTLDVKTIFHLLDAAKVNYRIYETDPSVSSMNFFTNFRATHQPNFAPLSDYFKDLGQGTLPPVVFIETGQLSGQDEHPDNPIQQGAAFTANVINALMTSSAWKDSVFILSYDEGGGGYDHVPPASAVSPDGIPPQDLRPTDTPGDFNFTGFRVGTIVISPFSRKNYVSHTTMDTTAILKFIETRFGLPSLTKRDAAQPDMLEFFDFDRVPWATPPAPPAQPNNMP